MLFEFQAESALLLPFVVPGAALALYLLGRAARVGTLSDGLLAVLLLLNVLPVAQWMLGYAGWYDSHDGYSTFMFYVPWQLWLGWGPAFYLYFRSLTNQEFRLRGQWRHLLPALGYVAVFAGAAVYDLGWCRGVLGQNLPYHFGTKGLAGNWLDGVRSLADWLGYTLMLAYGWATLRQFRQYRRYLDDNFSDTARLRFRGLRNVLVAALLGVSLWLGFEVLNSLLGPFSYGGYWYAYLANGLLIYYLALVGLHANFAAAMPLRFEPVPAAPLQPVEPPFPVESAAPVLAEAAAPALPSPAPAAERPDPLAPELHPWREKLLALMTEEQPWLEPELTLAELAHRLRTNTSLLSHVINTGCGQNFNDFVNRYRVAEAERKLQNPRLAHYSLVGIALESGFNSKSTFNRVFKKLTGRTPGEIARPKP